MKRTRRARRRVRGLATLEMVLCLPVLLFIMALMINFGTAAAWKVRTLVAARHAVWSTRWPRDNGEGQLPRADDWPQSAQSGAPGDSNITELDDNRLEQPVVRGPLSYGAAIDPDMYDMMTMSHGARKGNASIQRDFPLLPTVGPYHLKASCPLLDNDWRYRRMPWDNEYWYWWDNHNERRRIPIIYDLGIITPQSDLTESLYQDAAFRNAFFAMAGAVNWDDFMAMGGPGDVYGNDMRDDEDEFYENFFPPKIYVDPLGVQHSIPFGRHHHRVTARLTPFCTLDENVIKQLVDHLIDDIQGKKNPHVPGVPERVAREYRSLYQAVSDRFANPEPNDPPPMAGETAALDRKLQELKKFVGSL